MLSNKSKIIENIFRSRWERDHLTNPIVSLEDVQHAIDEFNSVPANKDKKLSSKNPANFFKDFHRISNTANKNWPPFVFEKGYTAEQMTGGGNCFKFIPLDRGQQTAFPDSSIQYPRKPKNTKVGIVQTLSIPLPNKILSREDENWLQHISITLNLPQQ